MTDVSQLQKEIRRLEHKLHLAELENTRISQSRDDYKRKWKKVHRKYQKMKKEKREASGKQNQYQSR